MIPESNRYGVQQFLISVYCACVGEMLIGFLCERAKKPDVREAEGRLFEYYPSGMSRSESETSDRNWCQMG